MNAASTSIRGRVGKKEHMVALLETQQLGQVGKRCVIAELFEYHIRNIKDMTASRKDRYGTLEEI